jgi:hypothetical protein
MFSYFFMNDRHWWLNGRTSRTSHFVTESQEDQIGLERRVVHMKIEIIIKQSESTNGLQNKINDDLNTPKIITQIIMKTSKATFWAYSIFPIINMLDQTALWHAPWRMQCFHVSFVANGWMIVALQRFKNRKIVRNFMVRKHYNLIVPHVEVHLRHH